MIKASRRVSVAVASAATVLSCLTLPACGGGGDAGGTSAASAEPTDTGLSAAERTAHALAATRTAQSDVNACAEVRPFYWEVGDKAQRLVGGSVAKPGSSVGYDADTQMPIASASKWLYAAYVAERRDGLPTLQDVRFLHFQSGYTSFGFSGCNTDDSVQSCLERDDNGQLTPANIGKFYYNGGHMQKHANLPLPDGMGLGTLDNAELAREMRRVLGTDLAITYTQPQLAGGVRTSANGYAVYLRKLLDHRLKMADLLGSHAVCTNPQSCPTAVYTPITPSLDWHYSLGHWVEDDPVVGDASFSSPGAFGFYPWVDAHLQYYGIVARVSANGAANESAACGALIRKAWLTGTAR